MNVGIDVVWMWVWMWAAPHVPHMWTWAGPQADGHPLARRSLPVPPAAGGRSRGENIDEQLEGGRRRYTHSGRTTTGTPCPAPAHQPPHRSGGPHSQTPNFQLPTPNSQLPTPLPAASNRSPLTLMVGCTSPGGGAPGNSVNLRAAAKSVRSSDTRVRASEGKVLPVPAGRDVKVAGRHRLKITTSRRRMGK